jgi:hypothetical protein
MLVALPKNSVPRCTLKSRATAVSFGALLHVQESGVVDRLRVPTMEVPRRINLLNWSGNEMLGLRP